MWRWQGWTQTVADALAPSGTTLPHSVRFACSDIGHVYAYPRNEVQARKEVILNRREAATVCAFQVIRTHWWPDCVTKPIRSL